MRVVLYHLLPGPVSAQLVPAERPLASEARAVLQLVARLLGRDHLQVGRLLLLHALRVAPAHHFARTFLVKTYIHNPHSQTIATVLWGLFYKNVTCVEVK